ncbi:MAG TPA: hypothetical protein DEA96_07735 [Leptospiraceae bacterium]|nr:hypothetical protein [Spirochaetaceae bacterium]HBS04837.1 hypothetical protein [Leptospiraceae bacterium]
MSKKLTILAGIALLAITIMMALVGPQNVTGMPDGFSTPIMAFEFLRTPEEVYSMFAIQIERSASSAVASCEAFTSEASYIISGLDTINHLDSGYILAYTAFIVFLGSLRFGRDRKKLAVVWVFALIAMVFDLLENIALLGITEALRYCLAWSTEKNGPAIIENWLHLLIPFTHIKWAAIPLAFLWGIRGEKPVSKVSYIARQASIAFALFALVFLVIGMFHRSVVNELMGLCVALCFLSGFIEAIFHKEAS